MAMPGAESRGFWESNPAGGGGGVGGAMLAA